MMNAFSWIAIFAFSALLVNTIGIFTVFKHKKLAEKTKSYLICFAAGVLISTPLIFSLPQAINKNAYAGFAALVGFLFMLFSNQVIKHKTKKNSLAFGITAIEGIGIHSFVDGAIYAITFSVSILTGFLTGIGLVLHEFAEGVITFSVLTNGGVKRKKAMFYAFLVAAVTTPVGAFLAYPLMGKLNPSLLGLLLGFVSGVLIYVSSSHLLPEGRKNGEKHSLWAFLLGVSLALVMVFIKIFN